VAVTNDDRHRLGVLGGLAALSLDAMASVAYGPEAIVLVLALGGASAIGLTIPLTIAIAALLLVLVLSYRQVIAAFPNGGGSYGVALGVLLLVTAVNLRGVANGARLFIAPTAIFVAAILTVILAGLFRAGPAAVAAGNAEQAGQVHAIGVLLLLKAFANGCAALTGVEAIANAAPSFRKPRVVRAQRAELTLGVLLGVMLIGRAGLGCSPHRRPR
jgi:amino acid transporter